MYNHQKTKLEHHQKHTEPKVMCFTINKPNIIIEIVELTIVHDPTIFLCWFPPNPTIRPSFMTSSFKKNLIDHVIIKRFNYRIKKVGIYLNNRKRNRKRYLTDRRDKMY